MASTKKVPDAPETETVDGFSIQRVPFPGLGSVNGRSAHYYLIVNGVNLGTIRRTVGFGYDRMAGRRQIRYTVWQISGIQIQDRYEAEAKMIEQAIHFGQL